MRIWRVWIHQLCKPSELLLQVWLVWEALDLLPYIRDLPSSRLDMVESNTHGLVRREVPLRVVSSRNAVEGGLQDLLVVERTLMLEQRNAYMAAVSAKDRSDVTGCFHALSNVV